MNESDRLFLKLISKFGGLGKVISINHFLDSKIELSYKRKDKKFYIRTTPASFAFSESEDTKILIATISFYPVIIETNKIIGIRLVIDGGNQSAEFIYSEPSNACPEYQDLVINIVNDRE